LAAATLPSGLLIAERGAAVSLSLSLPLSLPPPLPSISTLLLRSHSHAHHPRLIRILCRGSRAILTDSSKHLFQFLFSSPLPDSSLRSGSRWDSILQDLFRGTRSCRIFSAGAKSDPYAFSADNFLFHPPLHPPPFLLRQKVHLAARVDIFIDFVYFIVLCFLFLLLLRFFVVVVAVTKQNKRRTQLQNQSNERIRERERIRKRMEPSEMRKNCQHQQITDCTSTLDGSAGSGRKCRKSRMLNQVAYLIAYPSLER